MTEYEELYSTTDCFISQVMQPGLHSLLDRRKAGFMHFHIFFNYFQTNTSVSKLFHSYFKKPIFIHVFISLLTFSCTYDLLETFHCVLFSGCHWNTSLETSCTELHFQNCTSQKICFYTFAHFYTFTRSDLVSSLIQDTGLVSLPMRPLVNIIHQSK